jgi:4-oxalocrotonate tautomerase
MPLVSVKLTEGSFIERQKRDMTARLADVMIAFEGSEAFREVVWVLIEEIPRDGWHIGGQPFFGPPTLMGALSRSKAAYEAIDGTPATREDLATPGPCPQRRPAAAYRRIGNLHAVRAQHRAGGSRTGRAHPRPGRRTAALSAGSRRTPRLGPIGPARLERPVH